MPQTHKELISQLLPDIKKDLSLQTLSDEIVRFGGHPLKVLVDGKYENFWTEFIRITENNGTLVFRAITQNRKKEIDSQDTTNATVGIRSLILPFESESKAKAKLLIDARSNIERELEPGLETLPYNQTDDLLVSYKRLLSSEISCILMPTREGSLGVTKAVKDLPAFTEQSIKANPHIWDIDEEVRIARLYNLAFHSESEFVPEILTFLRSSVLKEYTVFAQPLAKLLQLDIELTQMPELPASSFNRAVACEFFNDDEKSTMIQLGNESRKVDQVIAYPYPTKHGIVYVTLFRVWNAEKSDFEVIRVLQTKPTSDRIDGLRIDSSCIDGVHSMDCHCDCKVQLEDALYGFGLDIDKNVMVVQMADHEGKAWGTVLKGAGQHRLVRTINDTNPIQPISHVEAAGIFCDLLEIPHDNRTYDAAQAVLKFLNITAVDRLLMDNSKKIEAMSQVGITFNEKIPLYIHTGSLSPEAKNGITAKINGLVHGVYYSG